MTGEEKSLASLFALSRKKQLAFVLLVLERMLPSLGDFSEDTGFDDSCYLRARDAAWAALQNDGRDIIDQSLSETCLKNAPDTEAFSHELTSCALNAALATTDILEFLVDCHFDHIADVLTLARDSVYLYVGALEPAVVSSAEKDKGILTNPLMLLELRHEEQDIEFLSELPRDFGSDTVSALKIRARNQLPAVPRLRRHD